MIKLKHILIEDEISDKFGNVAFGGSAKIAALQNKDREKDTEFEKEILKKIKLWVNAELQSDESIYDNRNIIKKASKKFPEIFKPYTSNGTYLYRGLSGFASSNSLRDSVLKTKSEDWTESVITGWYNFKKPIKYTPHKLVQSWSDDFKVAYKFSNTSRMGGGILMTKQSDEFFFNQKFIEIIYSGRYESEVLHIGQSYKNDVELLISKKWYSELKSENNI